MTGEAGRSQGGNFLPLNRPQEKEARSRTGSLVVGLNVI